MASMTLTAPNGAKVRTASRRRYAVAYGWKQYHPGNTWTLKATCVKRSDDLNVARAATRKFGVYNCYIYDTETKGRVR